VLKAICLDVHSNGLVWKAVQSPCGTRDSTHILKHENSRASRDMHIPAGPTLDVKDTVESWCEVFESEPPASPEQIWPLHRFVIESKHCVLSLCNPWCYIQNSRVGTTVNHNPWFTWTSQVYRTTTELLHLKYNALTMSLS